MRRRRLPRRPMLPPALALCERMLHAIAGAKRCTRAACRGVTLRRYTPESTPAPGGITGYTTTLYTHCVALLLLRSRRRRQAEL